MIFGGAIAATMNYLQEATNLPVATRDELGKRLTPAPARG